MIFHYMLIQAALLCWAGCMLDSAVHIYVKNENVLKVTWAVMYTSEVVLSLKHC